MSCKDDCVKANTCQMKETKKRHADKFKGTCHFYQAPKGVKQ